MTRQIDYNTLIEYLENNYGMQDLLTVADVKDIIEIQPTVYSTVEVEPVKPVEWQIWHIFYEDGDGWYAECPNCGKRYPAIDVANWNYCPTCGAKMDAERKEE